MLERLQEKNQTGMLKIRRAIAIRKFKQEESDLIIEKIVNRIPKDFSKFIPSLYSIHNDEILRRFSLLTREFVTTCVHRARDLFHLLNFMTSNFQIIDYAIKVMQLRLIVIPEFGPINCVLVRQRIAEIISRVMNELRTEHLTRIRNERMSFMYKRRSKFSYRKSTRFVLINEPDGDTEIKDNQSSRVDFQLPTNSHEEVSKMAFERKREMLKRGKARFVRKIIMYVIKSYLKCVSKYFHFSTI